MLELTGVGVHYAGAMALSGVDLHVARGELVALVGSNGAGKTSLLAAVSGLHRPVSGRIVFDGTDITRLPAHKVARLGLTLVPEGRRLFARLSVRTNLNLGAYGRVAGSGSPPPSPRGRLLRRRPLRSLVGSPLQRTRDLDRVFALFPALKDRLDQRAGTLSGGEQQMLALGRALMSRPRMLLLDEPSLGVAPRVAARLFETIAAVREEGVTVLLVEQNLRAALKLADRLYVLQSGQVVLTGSPEEIENSDLVRRAYLGL